MNKFLLASTALVASASFAMADVDLSGSAEMGVFGVDSDIAANDRDLQFHTDIDVTFSMSGETDAGLTFGASVDLDEGGAGSAAHANDQDDGGATIFVSGDFGTVTMGDTDGAFDWALTEAIIGSSLQDDHEHAGYSGNAGLDGTYDGQIARYDYSFGDFAFAASAEIQDAPAGTGDPVFGLGLTYNIDLGTSSVALGLGYQTVDTGVVATSRDIVGVSAALNMDNGLRAIVNYSDLDGQTVGSNDNHYGIAVGYTFGELLVAANYGQYDLVGGGDNSGFGLIANYDLGGGASLQAGYGSSDNAAVNTDEDTYSFGIAMSF